METKTSDSEQQLPKLRIQIVANGPALIQGPVIITDQHGRKEQKTAFLPCAAAAVRTAGHIAMAHITTMVLPIKFN